MEVLSLAGSFEEQVEYQANQEWDGYLMLSYDTRVSPTYVHLGIIAIPVSFHD